MRFGRKVPVEVQGLLTAGERVLAWSELSDGGWMVATDLRLHATEPALDVSWVDVIGAGWEAPELTVRLWVGVGNKEVSYRITEERTLPQVIRERVEETLLVQTKVEISGRHGMRFLARRVPGTGDTLWQQIADPGLDLDDPAVQARVDSAQRQLRDLFGV